MTVEIEGVVSRALPSSGGATTVEVTLEATGKTRPTTRHVVLLIDTSFSMFGSKIEQAKAGAESALDELDDDDYVSVVGFDSSLDVVLPMSRWGDVRQADRAQDVGKLDADGGTDIYKGLEESRDQLMEGTPDDDRAVKRIILLSDGEDRYEASTYRDLASDFDEEGISIVAAGVGAEYDGQVMLALANSSGGKPIDLDEDDIDAFLGETVRATDSVLAPNPELEISLTDAFVIDDETVYFDAPKVERRRVDTSRDPSVLGLPELQVGAPHRFTFEVLGKPRSPGPTRDLGTLRAVDGTGSTLAETTVEVPYTDDGGLQRADVEKSRTAAKVTTDIQDPDVSKVEVEADIETAEDRGWTDTAKKLRGRLARAEGPTGIVRLSDASDEGANGDGRS